jgi:cytochrome P450
MNVSTAGCAPAGPDREPAGAAAVSYESLWELRRAHASPLAFLLELARRGDAVRFTVTRQPAVLINHPAHAERVLATRGAAYAKAPALTRAKRLLGRGLLAAEPPRHTERRRIMQPAFHRQRVAAYADTIVRRARESSAAWIPGQPLDILQEMTTLTLATVGDTLFGADLTPHAPRIRRCMATSMAILDPIVALVAPARRLRPARERLLEIIGELVETRRAAGSGGDDLLGLLLAAREDEDDDEQLYDDVLTILLAGHDTIANALVWTWAFLAEHPDVDARLAAEAADVLGGGPARADHLPQLTFTRAVLAESLRLRPPAWLLARKALEPDAFGTVEVAPGSLVLLSPYLLHRDPRSFDEPETFDPARWLDERRAPAAPRFAYVPFGGGRRACIGESFAWMEGTLVLATLASRWRLMLSGARPEPDMRITMRPAAGLRMTPHERHPSEMR